MTLETSLMSTPVTILFFVISILCIAVTALIITLLVKFVAKYKRI